MPYAIRLTRSVLKANLAYGCTWSRQRPPSHLPGFFALTFPYHKPTVTMASASALFSTSSLRAAGAKAYSSMDGKLDPSLLQGLQDMGMSYMTPVQQKMLELPSLRSDWYVRSLFAKDKYIMITRLIFPHILVLYVRKQGLARLLRSSFQLYKTC